MSTLPRVAEGATLVVLSDHGFTSWRRAFHLNTWLQKEGYLTARDPNLKDDPGLYTNVDWSRTRAYALGLNGLLQMGLLLGLSVLGLQFSDIAKFILEQPASTAIGVGYMRNGTVFTVQNMTTDHALAAKSLRLPIGPGASTSPYLSLADLMKRWPETSDRREILGALNL